MRALIYKEMAENRALLLFSAVLTTLLLVAGWLLQTYKLVFLEDLSELSVVFFVVPPAFGVLAGAALLAGESTRGTMPLLFGLPFSRLGIWTAKVLSGTSLAILSALPPTLCLSLILWQWYGAPLMATLICCVAVWTITALAFSLFCSTLSERPLNALLTALMLLAVSAMGALALMHRLLPEDINPNSLPIFTSLMGATMPALLFASALTVQKGELLTQAGKWAYALVSLAAGLAVMAAVVVPILACCVR